MLWHSLRKLIHTTVALVLALSLLSGAALAEGLLDVNSVSVNSAPLSKNSSAVNGMVRVYLSSLGNPTSLSLTAVGNYSINGDTSRPLTSGSTVTVGFSSSTGAITLTQNGTKYNMGTYFALRRHSATGTNGIKIAQAKEPGNAYPGDISFRAVNQGGSYKLYTVAHIYIENYLYGVLPYEMGNSTNIEALKAQAVAARTYTVRMMNARASGQYDVVDTTNDQVYRGTPSGNANCVSAVNATKGIVLMYGSGYAMTYYSASNGGQTESAKNLWGYSGYDYLTVRDDPFDYSNPSSTVKKATVNKDLSSGSGNAALLNLLKSKTVTALKSAGYAATSGNTTLQTLKSVTPHTPKFGSPSRLYTKMDFTLTASVAGKTATTTVTLDIFGELESALGMSIQTSKNELWSIVSSASAFTLQARRFGHGIGMSQRGAMYMAKLGYTYDEILGFYYVGCKRVQHSFTNTILAAGSGDTQTVVESPADMEEESSACKGTVKLVSASSSIAIRASKSTTGAIIGTAGNGAIMSVLASDGTWCYVRYGSIEGYLPANALTISGTPDGSEGAPTSIEGFATVTANDYVNLRESGSMSARVVSTAPTGAVLTVFSRSGVWAYVQYCATVAYVHTNYVNVTSAYPSSTSSTGSASATVTTEDGTGTVNLRASASTGAQALAKVPAGETVTVSSDDGSWAVVSYNGTSGYMLSSFLKYTGESLEDTDGDDTPDDGEQEPKDDSTDEPTDEPDDDEAIKATVSAELGYLRESESADAPSLLVLAQGDTVTVTKRGSEWCTVTVGDISGCMLTSSLDFGNEEDGGGMGGDTPGASMATVTTASGSLNLRAEAKAGSAVLTTIPWHARVEVYSVGAVWCGVTYNGISGYAMSCFLTLDGGGAVDTPSGETAKTATVATQSGSLNLRAQARAGSQILRTIPQYATVDVHSYGAEWSDVSYQGTRGYVMTVFLAFDSTDIPTDDEPEDTDPDEGGETDGTDENDPDEPLVPDETDENTLYAVVSTVSGSLNMRAAALPGSDVVARIPKGTTIVITQKLSAWSLTTFAGQTGYVMNAFLSFHQGQLSTEDAQTATVTTLSGSLNLRTEPSANAGVTLRIPQYATVAVEQRGQTWCYVSYGGSMGYVMTQFLTFAEATGEPESTPTDEEKDGETDDRPADGEEEPDEPAETQIAYVQTASGSLNLRESPQSGARVLTTVPRGRAVNVIDRQSDWCQVTYESYAGYVATTFLRFDAAAASTPTDEDDQTAEKPDDTIDKEEKSEPVEEGGDSTGAEEEPQSTESDEPEKTGVDDASGTALDVTLQAPEEGAYAIVSPLGGAETLGLYTECSEASELMHAMPRDEQVEIILIGRDWCRVQYGNVQGYCLTSGLLVLIP